MLSRSVRLTLSMAGNISAWTVLFVWLLASPIPRPLGRHGAVALGIALCAIGGWLCHVASLSIRWVAAGSALGVILAGMEARWRDTIESDLERVWNGIRDLGFYPVLFCGAAVGGWFVANLVSRRWCKRESISNAAGSASSGGRMPSSGAS
jgi:hypothetical protein